MDAVEGAAADLAAGAPFAEVAKARSAGPKSHDGGRWDWTAPDSLADAAADAALWTQPVGEIGAVVDCPRAGGAGVLKLIRVDERRGDAPPPLSELKDKIEEVLTNQKRDRLVAAVRAEQRAKAHVEILVPGVAWPPEE